GQRRGIDDREGNREEPREGLREQGLPRARRTDQEDVRLLDLDLALALGELIALVVVVDRDGELLLRLVLADHVLIEEGLDLARLRQPVLVDALFRLALLGDDVETDVDALVADVDGRAGDEFANVALVLVAERAA